MGETASTEPTMTYISGYVIKKVVYLNADQVINSLYASGYATLAKQITEITQMIRENAR